MFDPQSAVRLEWLGVGPRRERMKQTQYIIVVAVGLVAAAAGFFGGRCGTDEVEPRTAEAVAEEEAARRRASEARAAEKVVVRHVAGKAPKKEIIELGDPDGKPPEEDGMKPPPDKAPRPEEFECPACPECEACPVSPPCPGRTTVCKTYIEMAGELKRKLDKTERELAQTKARTPREKYAVATANERRTMAAQDDTLLVELPAWGQELSLDDERVALMGLTPDERARLEEMYREFRTGTFGELQKMYAELIGDPEAGSSSTIGSLVHNIIGLSPHQDCEERMAAMMMVLAAGGSLTPPAADALACERAAYLIFAAVDNLEAEVTGSLGEKAAEALWSGSSSFSYSSSWKEEEQQ